MSRTIGGTFHVTGDLGVTGTATMPLMRIGAVGQPIIAELSLDDTMASNSDTKIPTQHSVRVYADTTAGIGMTVALPLKVNVGVLRLVNTASTRVSLIDTDTTFVTNPATSVSTQHAIKTHTDATFISRHSPVTFTGALGTMTLTQASATQWTSNMGLTVPNMTTAHATLHNTLLNGVLDVASGSLYLTAVDNVNVAPRMICSDVTNATSASIGSVVVTGGLGVAKDVRLGGNLRFAGVNMQLPMKLYGGGDALDMPIAATPHSCLGYYANLTATGVTHKCYCNFVVPQGWKNDADMTFFVTFISDTATPAVSWTIYGTVAHPGGVSPVTSFVDRPIDLSGVLTLANTMYRVSSGTIASTGIVAGDTLMFQLQIACSAGAPIQVWAIHPTLQYTADSLGLLIP